MKEFELLISFIVILCISCGKNTPPSSDVKIDCPVTKDIPVFDNAGDQDHGWAIYKKNCNLEEGSCHLRKNLIEPGDVRVSISINVFGPEFLLPRQTIFLAGVPEDEGMYKAESFNAKNSRILTTNGYDDRNYEDTYSLDLNYDNWVQIIENRRVGIVVGRFQAQFNLNKPKVNPLNPDRLLLQEAEFEARVVY